MAHDGFPGLEGELQPDTGFGVTGDDLDAAGVVAAHLPVVEPDLEIVGRPAGETAAGTPEPLRVVELARLDVGDGEVGGRDLAGAQDRRPGLRVAGGESLAEEGDLEAVATTAGVVHQTGDVPPLGPGLGVGAVIAREGRVRAGR